MRAARLTAVCVAAMLAQADANPKQDAKEHIARATQLHKDGQFDEARVELEAAHALDPKPELLYALGQVHVKLGKCDRAITFYEQFLETRPKRGQAAAARQAIQVCK